MERGGRGAFIGAGRGCGVARISSSARASPDGFGVRVRLPDPVQGEQEVRDDGVGPHASAALRAKGAEAGE